MLRFLASGLIALGLAADAAFAASTCADLGAELSRLRFGSSPEMAAEPAKYQREWIEQSAALAREKSKARRASCSGRGFLFFRAKPQPACQQIVPKVRKLEAIVKKLDNLRRQVPGAGTDRNRIAQIRTIMAQNNCLDDFQMTTFRSRAEFDDFFNGDFDLEMTPGFTFRTLCVRSCDGYYFPISFATTRNQFAADRMTCEAMCPGATVELYYHDNPGATAEDMISLYGVPYENHPAAFRYRSKYDKSCSCGSNRPPLFTVAEKLPLSKIKRTLSLENPALPGGAVTAPVPVARTAPGEDPETPINRAGDMETGQVTSLAGASRSTTRDGRPVRIVGPAYWGGQEEEEVVLIPVPNRAR
ncbi:MAG: DUF2865 domain-containing protein [Alphaproteobacteria bacterium]|nr:MAG: DUF2865 domain-containing protein [Alphaproteobacteria bacterium]